MCEDLGAVSAEWLYKSSIVGRVMQDIPAENRSLVAHAILEIITRIAQRVVGGDYTEMTLEIIAHEGAVIKLIAEHDIAPPTPTSS